MKYIKKVTVVEKAPHPMTLASLPRGSGKIIRSEPASWNIFKNKFSGIFLKQVFWNILKNKFSGIF